MIFHQNKINIAYDIGLIAIVILFSINILFVGIISDYTLTYAHSGLGKINDLNFFDNLLFNLKTWWFEKNQIRLAIILQVLIGYLNNIFLIKIIHLIIFLFFLYKIFKLSLIFFDKKISKFIVINFLCIAQFTEYLDPFIAWPEGYLLSFIIGILCIEISHKIIQKENINKNYFVFLMFLTLFYQEMSMIFYIFPIFSIFILFFEKKKLDKILILLIMLPLFVYLILRIYITNFFELEIAAASTSIYFSFPETIMSFFYHLVRTFPLTWLFVDGKIEQFINLLVDNFSILHLFVSIILYILFKHFLILGTFSIKQKVLFNFTLVFLLFIPPTIIAFNERYLLQISNHGIGHAHYIIICQYVGLIFLFLKILFCFSKKKIMINFLSIFLTIIFFLNLNQAKLTVQNLQQEINLYPYILMESFTERHDFLNVNKIYFSTNKYHGFWQHNHLISSFFQKKIISYSNFHLKKNKLENFNFEVNDKVLVIEDLEINKNKKSYIAYCFFNLSDFYKNNKKLLCNDTKKFTKRHHLIYF